MALTVFIMKIVVSVIHVKQFELSVNKTIVQNKSDGLLSQLFLDQVNNCIDAQLMDLFN